MVEPSLHPDVTSNRIKAAIREGRRARGLGLRIPCPELVEMLAPLGLDFVLIDGEHGPFGRAEIEAVCRVADASGVTPIARVPDLAGTTIGGFLDRGVRGILGPHVRSRADAEQLVRASLFPPDGVRSYGAARGDRHGRVGDFGAHCEAINAEISIAALLEDTEALHNLDEILQVEGIDYFAVGRFDLSLSLGRPPDHSRVADAIAEIEGSVRSAGRRTRDDFIAFTWDQDLIRAGASATLFSS
jgi:2-keto-3-deoxy-L-rhamnonate aldolase RhmA